MKRPWDLIGTITFAVVACTVGGAVIAQTPGEPVAVPPAEVQPYLVRSGDTSFNAIGERLCGVANRTVVGAQIQRMNPGAGTLTVDEALEVPTHCPAPVPTTTSTTSTVAPTTTVGPTSTTLSPTTTSTVAAPTTTAPAATTTSTTTVPSTVPPSGGDFVATFNTPDEFYDRFQLDAHFRDVEMGDGGAVLWNTPISGDHNHACESPATQRTIHANPVIDGGPRAGEDARLEASELFWWCLPNAANPDSAHVMTGMGNIDGYTILAFSPHRRFDNARKVCWDVNLTDMGRKWFSVFVIPEAAYQANGQRIDYIDGSSVDERAIVNPPGGFQFLFREGVVEAQNGATRVYEDWLSFITFDRAKRYKHCLTDLRNGNVLIEQQREPGGHERIGADGYWRQTVRGSFPAQARVIFADDSYNPGKDEPTPASLTWHWDNVLVDVD